MSDDWDAESWELYAGEAFDAMLADWDLPEDVLDEIDELSSEAETLFYFGFFDSDTSAEDRQWAREEFFDLMEEYGLDPDFFDWAEWREWMGYE